MVKHVRIDVSNCDGDVILGETHSVKLGAEGLMGFPARLGYKPSSLLCFPFEEEMGDLTNRGDPFTSICNLFLESCESSIATQLHDDGYEITEGSVAKIWVRVDGPKSTSCNIVGETGFDTNAPSSDAPSSQLSRVHLPFDVKARMKELCNEICPRNADGFLLAERAKAGDIKRPAWCIPLISTVLHTEFDASKLKGVEFKIAKHIARCGRVFKRLKDILEEAWERMSEGERLRQRAMLEDLELGAEIWRRGPYGILWISSNLRRQPTKAEIEECIMRHPQTASIPEKPKL